MWQVKGQQMGEAQLGVHYKGKNVWGQMEKKGMIRWVDNQAFVLNLV